MANIVLKTADEIDRMRIAGKVVHSTLMAMGAAIKPGLSTTADLERAAISAITGAGAVSAFLGYAPHGLPPFPAWTCISVNEEVVHGIGGRRVLMEGDVVSCDVGVKLNGVFADAAWTFPVGCVSEPVALLLKAGEECLLEGIRQVVAGCHVGDIGHAVEAHARRYGFSVVRDMVGHGVGKALHEPPQVPNYGRRGRGPVLDAGATIAIEPMINAGRSDIEALDDQWTIVASDRKPSVHFEHTVAVTRDGARILTVGD